MKFGQISFLCCFLVLLLQCRLTLEEKDFNPYAVLGVPRTASDKEIRQAYKKLARHWHPDKNSEPNAHEQFTNINAAYEILSDSTKRQQYDDYGTTSQDNQRGFNTNHFRDPFDIFRAHFGSDFQFFHESASGAKKFIHAREFLSNILPNSDHKPYVLYGSTNFCLQCRQSLSIFRSLEKQFNDVGIGTGEFNVNDQRLSHELGVINAPSLCVVSQRRVYHFNDHGRSDSYTETNIKEFVRKSIPIHRHIQTLSKAKDLLDFISSYNQTNRVQAILVTRLKTPTLKFVLPCLQYLSRIQCAVLNSSVINSFGQVLPSLRQLSTTSDTVLLFKEDRTPHAVLREGDVTYASIQKLFESNQLLHLPTMTSATVFNFVCEKNSAKPCFLIIGDSSLFEHSRSLFLRLAQQLSQQYSARMIFIDSSPNKQVPFGKLFSSIYHGNEKKLFIFVARRWFDDTIELVNTEVEFDEYSLDKFQRNQIQMIADIEANLKLFLNTRWQNAKKAALPVIFNLDERNENFLYKILDQIEEKWNYWFERNPILRTLSGYLFTYQFWMFFLPILLYFWYSKQDSANQSASHSKQAKKTFDPSNNNGKNKEDFSQDSNKAVSITEFDHTFLQRYNSPGAPNVIVLLLIADATNDPSIGYFRRQISSIRDSRMVFAILYREHSSRWLDELYANIESDQNKPLVQWTSSTVLALYIRRKFFVPYWSLNNHEEHDGESGAFIGMDHRYRSASTSSTDSLASTTDSLSFADWIDLLLDGTLRRPISVIDWPMNFS